MFFFITLFNYDNDNDDDNDDTDNDNEFILQPFVYSYTLCQLVLSDFSLYSLLTLKTAVRTTMEHLEIDMIVVENDQI